MIVDSMVLVLAAAVLAVHGLLHLVGFAVPWRLSGIEPISARRALGGHIQLNVRTARVIGVFWLGAAISFLVAAGGLLLGLPWAAELIIAAAVVSLALCIIGLPEMFLGVIANLLIIVVLLIVSR